MESSIIPIQFFPTKVLLVDDNEAFLSNLALTLSDRFCVETSYNPVNALRKIHSFSLISTDLYSGINKKECDFDDESQLEFNIDFTKIFNQIKNPERHNRYSVIVIDYSMPEMNGIDFVKSLNNTNIKKIMLTGTADYQLAVDAFNQGVIDRFIVKNSPTVIKDLQEAIKQLQIDYFRESILMLLNHLTNEKSFILTTEYRKLVNSFVCEVNAVEHYLIDGNGSRLFLNKHGEYSWLLLKSKENILEYYEVAEGNSAPNAIVNDLKSCSRMPFFLSEKERQYDVADWDKIMFPAIKLNDSNIYVSRIYKNRLSLES